jgi:hypothetical protein
MVNPIPPKIEIPPLIYEVIFFGNSDFFELNFKDKKKTGYLLFFYNKCFNFMMSI